MIARHDKTTKEKLDMVGITPEDLVESLLADPNVISADYDPTTGVFHIETTKGTLNFGGNPQQAGNC